MNACRMLQLPLLFATVVQRQPTPCTAHLQALERALTRCVPVLFSLLRQGLGGAASLLWSTTATSCGATRLLVRTQYSLCCLLGSVQVLLCVAQPTVCSLADVVATWSPPSARLCCPADFVREVVGGDEKVVLVGNSLGGYNALATAARHPDLVR